MLIILISHNLKQRIKQNKTIKSWIICSKDFASKQRGNMIIRSLFLVYHIYGMIHSFYQLFVKYILFCVIVCVVIAS